MGTDNTPHTTLAKHFATLNAKSDSLRTAANIGQQLDHGTYFTSQAFQVTMLAIAQSAHQAGQQGIPLNIPELIGAS